jgi:hypothetical protein
MVAYRSIGSIDDQPVPRRTTLAGVYLGSDGLIVLEVEETREGSAVREYAEVPLTFAGAVKLRDLLAGAIKQAGGGA